MGLWKTLFGSKARQSAASTASQPENIPAQRDAPAPAVSLNFEPTFKIGDRIGGRFEVHRVLGGGMGTVYVVYDHRDRNVLALKTFQNLAPEKSIEERALEQAFEKEASAWIDLARHPYIVRAWWVGRIHGQVFIAMEYIAPDRERNTLRHYLLGHPLPLEQVLRWGIEFCHGMEHAWGKGMLCHRDIKPDNILISSDGHVKIADFGLAAVQDQRGDPEPSGMWAATQPRGPEGSGLTVIRARKGQVGGTPGYMAPEVLRGEGADVRSDMYSFGVVLYQMVTGNPGVRLVNHYQLAPLAQVDSVLWPVIERCLLAEARSRYASFRLLRGELEGLTKKAGGVVAAPPKTKEFSVWDWSAKGSSLAQLGRKEEAIASFDRALEIDPRHVDAWDGKGKTLALLGCNEEAIACFDRALESDPNHVGAWIGKGVALSDLGRKQEAIACYDRALESAPRVARGWTEKGAALSDLGRKEEAIACYDRALGIDPRVTLAWNNKGAALSVLGRKQEAIACYDRALEIDTRVAPTWNNKGAALSEVGRHEEAITSYDRALEIDPKVAHAWYNKGASLSALGRKKEAAEAYRRFIAGAPTSYKQQIQRAKELIAELEGNASPGTLN